MALNLKPGQILQGSIYQPVQPSHYPLESVLATYPPDHYVHSSHVPTELSRVDYDAASAKSTLHRNQTLPVPTSARVPPEQFHHITRHVRPEEQTHRRPYPMDPSIYQHHQPPPSTGTQSGTHQPQMSRHPLGPASNTIPSHLYPGSDRGAKRHSSY